MSEIEIESFRGFAERKLLPLDADVVLVSGGNGTGKTSLTDAITWCLTGELPGLAQRLKGERKGEDYVVSCYGSSPARVRLTVRDDNQTWEIERRGGAGDSELTVTPSAALPSEAARDLAQLFGFEHHRTLAEAIHAWGILRQDSMRATLDEGSESLHRKLREILGLGALAEFEVATRDASQQLGDRAAAARKELDGLETRVRAAQTELDAAAAQQSTREVAQAAASARLDRLRTGPIAGVRLVVAA
jgi:DNA repair exonuclease SbcCD ATPase subunit